MNTNKTRVCKFQTDSQSGPYHECKKLEKLCRYEELIVPQIFCPKYEPIPLPTDHNWLNLVGQMHYDDGRPEFKCTKCGMLIRTRTEHIGRCNLKRIDEKLNTCPTCGKNTHWVPFDDEKDFICRG